MGTPTHFSCGVVYSRGREGTAVLIIDSQISIGKDKWGDPETKFPGGNQEPGETPIQTLIREVEEETGLKVERALEVCRRNVPRGPDHTQYAYLINIDDCSGRLRRDFRHDGRHRLSPPRWIPAYELLRHLKKMLPSRREIYLTAIEDLRDLDYLRPRS